MWISRNRWMPLLPAVLAGLLSSGLRDAASAAPRFEAKTLDHPHQIATVYDVVLAIGDTFRIDGVVILTPQDLLSKPAPADAAPPGHWAKEAVEAMYQAGLAPDRTIQRYDFAQLLRDALHMLCTRHLNTTWPPPAPERPRLESAPAPVTPAAEVPASGTAEPLFPRGKLKPEYFAQYVHPAGYAVQELRDLGIIQ